MMPADIVTPTDSNMLAMVGAIIRLGKVGMKGVMADRGKFAAPEFSSATNIFVRTAGATA